MTEQQQQPPVTEEMLHAYVDGQLDAAARAAVESWLAERPEQAARIGAWREQNAALRTLFPHPDRLPLPPAPGTSAHRPPWQALAAGVFLLGIGLAGGWSARAILAGHPGDETFAATLIDEALAAHVVYASDPVRPVEIPGTQEDLLLRWLSKRLGHALVVPDLSAQGFRLVGGRLLPAGRGPAAQFMYEDDAGRRITLLAVRQPGGQHAAFSYRRRGSTGSFYWQDEELAYALVGDVERETLSAIATAVYRQLS